MSDIEPTPPASISSAVSDLSWLSDADRPLVSRYLELWEERKDLVATRVEQGHFQYDDKGNATPHPVVKMIVDTEKMMLAIEREVGMTPASRLRLTGEALNNEAKALSLGDMLDGIED